MPAQNEYNVAKQTVRKINGTTMTISGTTLAGVALSGQHYVKYHVIGY